MQLLDQHRLGHIIEYTRGKMPWQAIKAMRNIVAHGYGNIELAVVWRTALEDIPALQAFCEEELCS